MDQINNWRFFFISFFSSISYYPLVSLDEKNIFPGQTCKRYNNAFQKSISRNLATDCISRNLSTFHQKISENNVKKCVMCCVLCCGRNVLLCNLWASGGQQALQICSPGTHSRPDWQQEYISDKNNSFMQFFLKSFLNFWSLKLDLHTHQLIRKAVH